MTLEHLERYARDIGYWFVALLTYGGAWYYSREMGRFDGLSLLLVLHGAWTLWHWFAGSYGKLNPAERISLEIEPPSKDDMMDEVEKRR